MQLPPEDTNYPLKVASIGYAAWFIVHIAVNPPSNWAEAAVTTLLGMAVMGLLSLLWQETL
jgi:hypothetical protein